MPWQTGFESPYTVFINIRLDNLFFQFRRTDELSLLCVEALDMIFARAENENDHVSTSGVLSLDTRACRHRVGNGLKVLQDGTAAVQVCSESSHNEGCVAIGQL